MRRFLLSAITPFAACSSDEAPGLRDSTPSNHNEVDYSYASWWSDRSPADKNERRLTEFKGLSVDQVTLRLTPEQNNQVSLPYYADTARYNPDVPDSVTADASNKQYALFAGIVYAEVHVDTPNTFNTANTNMKIVFPMTSTDGTSSGMCAMEYFTSMDDADPKVPAFV